MTAQAHYRSHVRHDGTALVLLWWSVVGLAGLALLVVVRHG